MPMIPVFVYLGGCKNVHEAAFLKVLSKTPCDVLILAPNLNVRCQLVDDALFELQYNDTMNVTEFPTEQSGLQIGTAAYHAERELDEAADFCRAEGVRHVVIDSEELDVPGFAENPPDRCYHCKRELFGKLVAFARENGLAAVLEGSNVDDDGDYRPGRRAIRELGVRSPLRDVGLTKAEIRALSRAMGLPTADKPSFACLASRFPVGEEAAGQPGKGKGAVTQHRRVRAAAFPLHGIGGSGVARIEVSPADIPRLAARAPELSDALRSIGFAYVSLDLRGYRTGSLNEALGASVRSDE